MMQPLIDTFLNYGIAGAIIVVLIIYLNQREKQHASERKEWRLESNQHVDKFAKVVEKSTEVLTKLNNSIQNVKEGNERIENKI